MRYIEDEDKRLEAERFIDEAGKVAQKASCQRARCGAVIVKGEEIIGRGHNSPAGDDEKERRCQNKKSEYDEKVTDKTCCVHAEQRAIIDALRNDPLKLEGARMYFARFFPDGERKKVGGKAQLYCTACTKLMKDVGISEFVLLHEKGIGAYTKDEYLKKSYDYGKYSL